jgi:hypothetical protein
MKRFEWNKKRSVRSPTLDLNEKRNINIRQLIIHKQVINEIVGRFFNIFFHTCVMYCMDGEKK